MPQIVIAVILSLLSLLALDAHAGVIYRWQETSTNLSLGPTQGFLEIDDAYWTPDGTFAVDLQPGRFNPSAGLLEFFWGPIAGTPVQISAEPCRDDIAACVSGVESVINGLVSLNINVALGSVLAGSIYANSQSSDVAMDGQLVWTILQFNTDGGPYACYFAGHDCGGGTGLWVLDLSTVSGIPEPGSLALVGVALAGLAAMRRRRMPLEEPGNASPVASNWLAGSHRTQQFGRFTACTPVLALDVGCSNSP